MDIKKITSRAWDLVHIPGFVEEFITQKAPAIAHLLPEGGIRFNFELMHGDEFVLEQGRNARKASHEHYVRVDYGTSSYDMQGFRFQKGFSFTRINCLVGLPATFHRANPRKNGLYEFIFPHPDTEFTIRLAGEKKVLGKDRAEGGIWASPGIGFDLCILKACELRMLSIVIDRESIRQFLSFDGNDIIHDLILNDNEFILFETFDEAMNRHLRNLFAHDKLDLAGMIELEAFTKLLMANFLQKILDRKKNKRPIRLNTPQIDRALEAKKAILGNLTEKPVLDDLAGRLGTNRVTLQKEFQELFGVSVYQYFLNSRLEKAKALLESGEYTVAEVSDSLGYPTPSQLSKSFTKRYGQSPVTFIP